MHVLFTCVLCVHPYLDSKTDKKKGRVKKADIVHDAVPTLSKEEADAKQEDQIKTIMAKRQQQYQALNIKTSVGTHGSEQVRTTSKWLSNLWLFA